MSRALNDLEYDYFQVGTESDFTSRRGQTNHTVLIKPNTDPSLNVPFLSTTILLTLDAAVSVGDTEIVFTDTTGVVVGDVLEIAAGNNFLQAGVLEVNVDGVTLKVDTPSPSTFTTSAVAQYATRTVSSANGSLTSPVIFNVLPLTDPTQKGEVHRVMFFMEDATAMDSTRFGGGLALTNGCVLRVNNGDGTYYNLFNIKTNGDLMLQCGNDVVFEDRIAAGDYSLVARCTFQGEDKRGVVIALDGSRGEVLELLVQDDLSARTNLNFEVVAQGHLTFT
jgi:hypothetical protein